MGRIPEEDIARVRDATDIVSFVSESVLLKKKGRLFWGLCPFHGEKTPSFKVDPATQLWHCFGCGEGGDVFGFAMQREHLEFPEAVRLLADRARIEIREEGGGLPRGLRERLMEACDSAAEFYHEVLTRSRDAEAVAARTYLADRGFGIDVARRFTLGFAPGRGALVTHLKKHGFSAEEMVEANLALTPREGAPTGGNALKDRFFGRVMFPIRDLNGRVIAFGGRVVGPGEPKYLNSSETPVFHKAANLYNIERAKAAIVATGTAVVVEGYTDVIALSEAGVPNVVATLGTALTRRHVRLLGRFAQRIVYLFDGDEAGLRAADRASEFIDASITPEAGGSRVELLVAVIPEGLDPADYVTAHGQEGMRQVIDGAEPLLRFAIERRLAANDLTTPGGRAKALAEAAMVVAPVKESILGHDYANYLADRLKVDFETARAAIRKARQLPEPREDEEGDPGRTKPAEPEVLDAATRAERFLVGLVAVTPRLRAGAHSLLDSPLFGDPLARSLLALVVEAGTLVDDELYRFVSKCDEHAAAVLSGLLVDAPAPEDVDSVARQTLAKVKELALERLIKEERARLRVLEGEGDRDAADTLFRKIAAMQTERDQLRRGVAPPEVGVWDQT